LAGNSIPSNLKGYGLRRTGGGSIFKKIIFLIIIALVLMYFFKRDLFNMIANYVLDLF